MSARQPVRGLLAALLVGTAACAAAPPDRQLRANELTAEIAALPGVLSASADVSDRIDTGDPHVWMSVNVAADAAAAQVTTVVGHYPAGIRAPDFAGHLTELVVHAADDRFAVDGGMRPSTGDDDVVAQAGDWVAMRRILPDATIDLRPAVRTAAGSTHRVIGRIDLADPAGAERVAAAVTTLGARFPRLTGGTWTIDGSVSHPSSVTTNGRWPDARELATFTALEADQVVPHVSALNLDAAQIPPLWISEWVPTHDSAVRYDLAARHLPMVATLPTPVLYTATDQVQGYRDASGRSTGPVAVTVGGCTTRTYAMGPAERQLAERYERCPHR